MDNREAVNWLINISADIGKVEHSDLWHYERALTEIKDMLESIQPVVTDTNVGDKISKFIDGLEEIFADLRERHVDDSVCGLCEYDGAYMGQSGDWCNECPGFDRDDCFKLSDETRKKWTDEIIKALPSAQPEIVRCKDCIYYNSDCVDAPYGLTHAIYWCDLHYDAVYDNLAVNPDDFCSRAERRADADD